MVASYDWPPCLVASTTLITEDCDVSHRDAGDHLPQRLPRTALTKTLTSGKSPPKSGIDRASIPKGAVVVTFDDLPDSGFVRQPQLIPSPLPWSSATLWRKCKRGEFVAPVKLSERVTAWNVGAVRRWLAAQAAK